MNEYLAFRRMVTPLVIQILFWIGVVLAVIGAIGVMTQGGISVLYGFIGLFLGPLAVRI